MRIYISSQFENREAVRALMQDLARVGISVTLDWTTHELPDDWRQSTEHCQTVKGWVRQDIEAVAAARVVVYLADGCTRYSAGVMAELGAALAWGRSVLVHGLPPQPITPMLYHSNVYWGTRTTEELRAVLMELDSGTPLFRLYRANLYGQSQAAG